MQETEERALKCLKAEKYEKSLETARRSLQYATAEKNNYYIATSYNLIGANYDGLSEFDKAIFFYKKGLDYANLTTDDTLKNYINNNLGNVYCFEKKEYETGIQFYKKSLEYSGKAVDSTQMVFTKLNIAWAYFDIG